MTTAIEMRKAFEAAMVKKTAEMMEDAKIYCDEVVEKYIMSANANLKSEVYFKIDPAYDKEMVLNYLYKNGYEVYSFGTKNREVCIKW